MRLTLSLRLRERLRDQAIRDPLTGLFNRRYMKEVFATELSRAERSKRPVGVILMDVDHVTRFNASRGRAERDGAWFGSQLASMTSRPVLAVARTQNVRTR